MEDILNDLNKTTNEASISPHLTSIKIDQVIKDIKICPEFLQTIEQQKQQNDRLLINDKLDVIKLTSDLVKKFVYLFKYIHKRVNHHALIHQNHVNQVCVA